MPRVTVQTGLRPGSPLDVSGGIASRFHLQQLANRIDLLAARQLPPPVAWEYTGNDHDERMMHRAKYCFGRVVGAKVDGDELLLSLDVPRQADADALAGVELEMAHNMFDGSGRFWSGPSVTHVNARLRHGLDIIQMSGDATYHRGEGRQIVRSSNPKAKVCQMQPQPQPKNTAICQQARQLLGAIGVQISDVADSPELILAELVAQLKSRGQEEMQFSMDRRRRPIVTQKQRDRQRAANDAALVSRKR